MTRRAAAPLGVGLALGLVVVALTASNTVAGGRISAGSSAIDANALKPPECAALNLTQVRVGGGAGGDNSLVLGTAGNDNLVGASGDDCLVGGAGNDRLNGNAGNDICVGGPGTDTFHASCETAIQ